VKTLAQRIAREERVGFELHNHLHLRVIQLKKNATRHELKIYAMLERLELPFRFQKGFTAKGVMYIADFYLPKPWKMVIEIDGASHLSKAQQRIDGTRDRYFMDIRRMRVLRMTNKEVEKCTLAELMSRIDMCRAIPLKKVRVLFGI